MSENLEKTIYCKRCGRQVVEDPVTVSDDVVKEYMRCRLGGRPFSREMRVLNGSFIITAETADADIIRLLDRYIDINGVLTNPDMQLLALISKLERVDLDSGITTTIYEADRSVRKAALTDTETGIGKLCANLDAVELGVVRRACKAFVILNNILMETIVDENFYKGVGLL